MPIIPLITIAVPSFNQGSYLEQCLSSIFEQQLPVEVFVVDGGSTDNSVAVIKSWEHKLSGWRSHSDRGQAAAINEAIAQGTAPYVCWVNSDDWLLQDGLQYLITALESSPDSPAAYGRAWNFDDKSGKKNRAWVEPFNDKRLALRCIVCQPATLIKRSAWELVGGVDENLQMAMDYDLWWRLFKSAGPLLFIEHFVAVNREHENTKTNTKRRLHYQEAMAVIRKHHGRVPFKWWLAQPYAVWFKSFKSNLFL